MLLVAMLIKEEAPSETEEFEASKPSDTRITSSHYLASSDSTAPLSPDHPLTRTSPTPAPTQVSFHRRTARMVVRIDHETPSPSSSPTLSIRKRYQGTSELVEDTKVKSLDSDTEREGLEDEGDGLEDEGPGLEEEEAAPEGQQYAIPVMDTAMDEPLRLGYAMLRRHELALGEGSVPSTFEIGQSSRSMSEQQRVEETPTSRPQVYTTWVDLVDGTVYTDIPVDVPPACVPIQIPPSPKWSSVSLPVSPSFLAVPTPVASLVTTPAATMAVDEDEFLEVRAQLELHGSILHDQTQHLDALPPTLFEGYDRDLRELYTRLGSVRDEIFS
ncbi:hypothetical protein Tco_0152674 [Tanacetum coccineum]